MNIFCQRIWVFIYILSWFLNGMCVFYVYVDAVCWRTHWPFKLSIGSGLWSMESSSDIPHIWTNALHAQCPSWPEDAFMVLAIMMISIVVCKRNLNFLLTYSIFMFSIHWLVLCDSEIYTVDEKHIPAASQPLPGQVWTTSRPLSNQFPTTFRPLASVFRQYVPGNNFP